MPPSKFTYDLPPDAPSPVLREDGIESGFIGTLQGLKYEYRPDITNRATLEQNFREKFEALNRVRLTDAEFARLLDEIVTPDVFAASKTLRSINAFTRDDGTPLNYSLVNLKDWCKNHFEVINQLRINTDNSHHRYDVLILINGVPCVQIEMKTLGVNPRRAMEQSVEYKNDPGNGYTKTLLCFMQLFIVSNRDRTYYFANNNARHFAFNAEERFLPIYEFADEDNTKITHLDPFAERFLKKCDLGRAISRTMVLLAGEQKLTTGFLDYSNRRRSRVTEDSSVTARSGEQGLFIPRSRGNRRGILDSSNRAEADENYRGILGSSDTGMKRGAALRRVGIGRAFSPRECAFRIPRAMPQAGMALGLWPSVSDKCHKSQTWLFFLNTLPSSAPTAHLYTSLGQRLRTCSPRHASIALVSPDAHHLQHQRPRSHARCPCASRPSRLPRHGRPQCGLRMFPRRRCR